MGPLNFFKGPIQTSKSSSGSLFKYTDHPRYSDGDECFHRCFNCMFHYRFLCWFSQPKASQ